MQGARRRREARPSGPGFVARKYPSIVQLAPDGVVHEIGGVDRVSVVRGPLRFDLWHSVQGGRLGVRVRSSWLEGSAGQDCNPSVTADGPYAVLRVIPCACNVIDLAAEPRPVGIAGDSWWQRLRGIAPTIEYFNGDQRVRDGASEATYFVLGRSISLQVGVAKGTEGTVRLAGREPPRSRPWAAARRRSVSMPSHTLMVRFSSCIEFFVTVCADRVVPCGASCPS